MLKALEVSELHPDVRVTKYVHTFEEAVPSYKEEMSILVQYINSHKVNTASDTTDVVKSDVIQIDKIELEVNDKVGEVELENNASEANVKA